MGQVLHGSVARRLMAFEVEATVGPGRHECSEAPPRTRTLKTRHDTA